jgi:hypothetical protein
MKRELVLKIINLLEDGWKLPESFLEGSWTLFESMMRKKINGLKKCAKGDVAEAIDRSGGRRRGWEVQNRD